MQGALIPPLTGIAQARFVAVGRNLLGLGEWLDEALIRQLIERETTWAESPAGRRELRGEVAAYRASVRALLDLVRVGWRVEVDRGTIELMPPPKLRARLRPEEVRASKEETRRNLWPLVAAQLDQPEFRKFIRRLEAPTPKTKTRSITQLIASGHEVATASYTRKDSLPPPGERPLPVRYNPICNSSPRMGVTNELVFRWARFGAIFVRLGLYPTYLCRVVQCCT